MIFPYPCNSSSLNSMTDLVKDPVARTTPAAPAATVALLVPAAPAATVALLVPAAPAVQAATVGEGCIGQRIESAAPCLLNMSIMIIYI